MAVQRTASDIMAIFAGLGLPVCDDWPSIKTKVESQKTRHLRDKNNPDAVVRERADRWFKDVSDLEHHRPEMLGIVYQYFKDNAGITLEAAIAMGIKTLTTELHNSLRQFLLRQCQTDDALADRFLADYLRETGLSGGGSQNLVHPAAIGDFRAAGGFGQVALSWSLPATNCDEVEILREEGGTGPGSSRETPHKIYRGRGDHFVDRDVGPGVWYTYRAHALYRGSEGADAVQSVRCPGEVKQAVAAWKEGAIQLTWELPGPDVAVLIFRRAGLPPSVRLEASGPRPGDPVTTQVYTGGGRSWSDTHVAEGTTYFYRIIADFGSDLYSQGVEVQGTAPRPVPPVAEVTAVYQRDEDKDLVVVEWKAPVGMPVQYTLVRRPGSAAPVRPDDGTVLLREAEQLQYRDEMKGCSGRRFVYAVFTTSAGRASRTGKASQPVDILTEVSRLAPRTTDGTVELQWETPPNVTNMIVRRGLNPPRDHGDGVLVHLTGPGNARDGGLTNGKRYHYLVCCGYRPDGATEVFSPGVRLVAVPDRLPEAVAELKFEVQGKEIKFSWSLPRHGEVVLLRSAQPHGRPLGHRLPAAEVNRLGSRIAASAAGRAVDSQPTSREPHYSLVTIAGEHAVLGGVCVAVAFPDVSDLRVAATRDGVILRWRWPEDCASVRIVRRLDRWPAGPEDPQAARLTCTREEYQNAGHLFVDGIQLKQASLYYILYAQPAGGAGRFSSPGTDTGCRTLVQWKPWMTVSYTLASLEDARAKKELEILWTWEFSDPFPDFGGLALVANEQHVPQNLEDGVVLATWRRKPGQKAGHYQGRVNLGPVQQQGWASFYCKAMMLDPSQSLTTLMIHPNPCVPIMANGVVHVPAPRRLEGPARPGGSRTVICPSCFEKFGVEEILYSSFGGGDPVKARWPVLDRLRGRPPQPPRDAQGRVLPRKLCPKPDCLQHRKALPFTAGAQDSLIIGLIGAIRSGKSHYIASLIQRLEGQVGQDMQASLTPVTDETPVRYRQDFFEPLYKDLRELPATAGTPSPLIYDLTFSGRLWGEEQNRAVTLAFYDTAGENFNKREEIQRMVKYLSVASAVMVLVDPLQLDEVRDVLQTTVSLPDREDPKAIIDRVLTELEQGQLLSGSGQISIPVGVVLTKADLLRDAGLIEANRLWCTETRHVGRFNLKAHRDMSGMMGEYVQRWHPALYNIVVQRIIRHAFFGVSATGCASDVRKSFKFISPWRVEDPLLWLLAELGVIPSR